MSQKPHIYVMPEEFMADQSVPAHWRLLGILNGFFFNHKDVYASNEWFQAQLGCSRPTITTAVEKLESLGLVTVVRTKTTRLIKNKGASSFASPRKPTYLPEANQLASNSDSNADSITPAKAEPIEEVKTDKDGKEVQPRKAANTDTAALRGVHWAERHSGRKFVNRLKQIKAINMGLKAGITQQQLVDRWEEMEGEEFWQGKGFDWANVVASFDRK